MHVVRRAAVSILMCAVAAVASITLTACHGSSTTTASTTAPTATFTYTATALTVAFDASASKSGVGGAITYAWSFGDQTPSTSTQATTGAQPSHVYAEPGTYYVTLIVSDSNATTGTTAQYVKVSGTPSNNYGVEDWIWFGGSKYANSVGNFQSQSTTSANPVNQPSARQLAATWAAPGTTNTTGKLWMFGGGGYDSTGASGFLNDLWYYTPGTCGTNTLNQRYCGTWTWVSGSNRANTLGVYTMDSSGNPTFSATNMPGARSAAANWTDTQGNFWLFGGNGYDSVGNLGNLNDLWVFNGTTGQANWVGGSAKTNGTGSTTTPYPGARSYATTWTDQSGRFWLFGGESLNSAGTASVDLNDLWYFTPSVTQDATTKAYVYGGTWTLVASGATNGTGTYGTQGTAASTNYPGARISAQAWVDGTGKIWLFGGSGIDSAGNAGALNDIWSYDISSKTWTWIAGSSTISAAEVAGTQGTAAAGNTPSARLGTSGWTDASGTVLWLFGGSGTDSTGTSTSSDGGGALNELWAFNTQTHYWAFMGGSSIAGTAGVFANDVGADTGLYYSTPGSRLWSSGWVDANGHFWLYGGTGDDMSGTSGYLNDLWQVKIVLAPK